MRSQAPQASSSQTLSGGFAATQGDSQPLRAKGRQNPARAHRGRAAVDPGIHPAPVYLAGVAPFDQVQWELRTASITGEGGQVFFEQKDVEVPAGWSQLATNVVVQKYFRGAVGTPSRERRCVS